MDQASMLRKMRMQDMMMGLAMPPSEIIPKGNRPARVIAITSGKGGVGKTNIAANLAYVLCNMKKKALVLDADTGLANVDLILGLTPKYNLYHVLRGERTISETILSGPGGVMVLPSSSGIQEMSELSSGQKLTLMDELRTLTGSIDFVLIDTAAGIAGNVMYFNSAAKEIIVVASSEPTSLTDAYALIKVLYQRHAKKRFRLLVNMVKTPGEAGEVFERLSKATDHFLNLTIEYLGYVLHDNKLKDAVKRQRAMVELYPNSPASECLHVVADKICREYPDDNGGGALDFFWENVLNKRHE